MSYVEDFLKALRSVETKQGTIMEFAHLGFVEMRAILKEVDERRARISGITQQLYDELHRRERVCPHVWSEPKYTPIHHPAVSWEGDPPGTMGVDWRGPGSAPAYDEPMWEPMWTRTCKLCDMVSQPTRTEPGPSRPKF
jgi:hypothetical protein